MLHLKQGSKKNPVKLRYAQACNLCGDIFRTTAPHRCFCDSCKATSDLYRFHDWLPDGPEGPAAMQETGGAKAA